ncbi:SDO1-like protein [Diplodia seriata]|uniref:SDO1-like protein n=1 Tax=Diplodia seriata TaxID=420778 RepID=A0A1S8B592_9PEZI|nr:SDO1-like protein [Diplodia seriata]
MSPRGEATQTKVHYKGKEDDFIIFVESEKAVKDWKADSSVPLAQVVNGWKIFVTHKHGNQGILDTASNAMLENEFGTHKEEDVVKQILEKGDTQSVEVRSLPFHPFLSSWKDAAEQPANTTTGEGSRRRHQPVQGRQRCPRLRRQRRVKLLISTTASFGYPATIRRMGTGFHLPFYFSIAWHHCNP